jgi:hypothetical protein
MIELIELKELPKINEHNFLELERFICQQIYNAFILPRTAIKRHIDFRLSPELDLKKA